VWVDREAPNLLNHAEEVMRDLIRRAGGEHVLPAALYRKNDQARANATMDPYALKTWCWEVLARANTMSLPTTYKPGTVDLAFLLKVAQLSWSAKDHGSHKNFWRSTVSISYASRTCHVRISMALRYSLWTARPLSV